MERFIQLNLKNDTEKPGSAGLPNPERKDPEPSPASKRLHRLLHKGPHKPGAEFSSRSGMFTK